jgi:hypothetical protein
MEATFPAHYGKPTPHKRDYRKVAFAPQVTDSHIPISQGLYETGPAPIPRKVLGYVVRAGQAVVALLLRLYPQSAHAAVQVAALEP